jgi:hypothetical protein
MQRVAAAHGEDINVAVQRLFWTLISYDILNWEPWHDEIVVIRLDLGGQAFFQKN